MDAEIGIIGGTGVYDPSLLENQQRVEMDTPYGKPSSPLVIGDFKGRKVAFLFRHGEKHTIPPHKVNWQANLWALKEAGCKHVLATCATGSLKEEMKPGEMVMVDQFVDLSKETHTYSDDGKVFHVGMAQPFCPDLRKSLVGAAEGLGIKAHPKGTYLKIEGPQFSTKAASEMYRQFADIIGMTGVPEAILARELEMCFAIVATITDYDSWIGEATPFEEMKILMGKSLDNTKKVLETVVPNIPRERGCLCKDARKGADA
jgi:5'-methylthioadenosine phosphorylase